MLAAYCCYIVLLLAAMGMAGWAFATPWLGALFPDAVPMSPATAALFAALAVATLRHDAGPGESRDRLGPGLAAICLLLAAQTELARLFGSGFGFEDLIVSWLEAAAGRTASLVSPATDAFFIVAALGCLSLDMATRRGLEAWDSTGGILGAVAFSGGLTTFLGYVIGSPLLYGTSITPIAATTALGFVLLGAAVTISAGERSLPLRLFYGDSVRARLMRVVVPLLVLGYTFTEILEILLTRYFQVNAALYLAGQVLVCALVVSAFIYGIGRGIDASLAEAGEARLAAKRKSDREQAFNAMILSHAPFGISIYDALTGQCIRASQTRAEIAGTTVDKVLATNFRQLPNWKESGLLALAEKVLAEGGRVRQDLEHTTISGLRRFLDITLVRFEIDDTPYLLHLSTDIGPRKAMERELRDRLLLIQSLMDAAPLPIYYKDEQGRYQGCNQAAADYLGIPRQWLIGKTVFDLFPRELAAEYDRKDKELLAQGGVQTFESTVVTPKGTTSDILFQKAVYRDIENRVIGLIGTVTDISMLKRAEQKIRESEEVLRKILSGIRAGIFIIDPAGFTIVEANDTAAEIVGAPRENLIGKPWREIGWRDTGGARPDEQIFLLGARDQLNRDVLVERPDGRIIPVMMTVITARHGGKMVIFEVIFDISERKALERQLFMAQKLESLGELAAGIAHEINTPIQYVGDNLHFLENAFGDILAALGRGGEDGAKTVKAGQDFDIDYFAKEIPLAIAQSQSGVRRVAEIVRAMKKFSHPGGEEKVSADLNEAVETTVLVSRNEWKYVADVDLDLDRDLAPVFCLPGDINQVLLNIVINAAHAIAETVKGGDEKGRITITTAGEAGFARISIKDTGGGIPPTHLNKIFDPFFTTKPVGKGTGQGLAIAHNIIVTKHHGTIDVESEPGQGATFHIRLPYGGSGQSGESG